MSTQRASAFRDRMAQANTRPPNTADTPSATEPASATTGPRNGESKFSVLFDTAEAVEFDEQCLRPVDDLEGPYPPGDLEALKQGRRVNAGRKGTTRAHRSSWSC